MKFHGIRFVPDDTKIPFMRLSRYGFFLSGVLCVVALLLFLAFDLNYGIDFKGGTLIEIKTAGGRRPRRAARPRSTTSVLATPSFRNSAAPATC